MKKSKSALSRAAGHCPPGRAGKSSQEAGGSSPAPEPEGDTDRAERARADAELRWTGAGPLDCCKPARHVLQSCLLALPLAVLLLPLPDTLPHGLGLMPRAGLDLAGMALALATQPRIFKQAPGDISCICIENSEVQSKGKSEHDCRASGCAIAG